MRDRTVEASSPAMNDSASPWKMGSNKITLAPTTTAAAVSSMGRKRTAPASTTASSSDIPCVAAQFNEVDEDDGIAHDDSGARDKSDHRRSREECSHQSVGRKNANQRQRNRRHDDQRRDE